MTVSIIVPVYNVEKYIRQCIETIIEQTYSDLEIILIDDGSTDNSGVYCDEAARKDSRIHVIHKKNGGLSAARNIGTTFAHGDFVFYLDSDDYLSKNAILNLINAQKKYDADIVIGNYYYTYSDREDLAINSIKKLQLYTNTEAIQLLMEGKLQTFAWGKLVRIDIAKSYKFPVGKLFEDHFWTHWIFHASNNIVFIKDAVIHYRQRDNSISYTFNIKRLDIIEGWKARLLFLEKYYPKLVKKYKKRCSEDTLSIAWLVLTQMKKQKRQAFKIIRNFVQEYELDKYCKKNDRKLIVALEYNSLFFAIEIIFYKILLKIKK